MSRIEDLLATMCPHGVEGRRLGEIAQLVRGNGMPRSDFTDAGVGCIHYGQIYMHYGTWATETISHVSLETAARLVKADPGDVVITNTSENLDDVCKAVAWLGDDQIVTGGHATVIKHQQDPKYLAYWFQSQSFSEQKRKLATGTKVIDVSATSLARVDVPVPPLEVQAEIVRVLDNFAALEAELEKALEAELEARRRQYAHIRDTLLTSSGGIGWATLSDVATFKYGFTASAAAVGDYRFLRITDITANGKLAPSDAKYVQASAEASGYLVKAGDLLMARTGATYGKTMLVESELAAVYASFLIRVRVDESIIMPGYYWHFAQSGHYWRQAEALVSTGGQPQFNANVLKTIQVPVPSLDEQARIVAILDTFDVLVNDLSVGLPAELAARRKQYEHYRDRLLTFPEAS